MNPSERKELFVLIAGQVANLVMILGFFIFLYLILNSAGVT